MVLDMLCTLDFSCKDALHILDDLMGLVIWMPSPWGEELFFSCTVYGRGDSQTDRAWVNPTLCAGRKDTDTSDRSGSTSHRWQAFGFVPSTYDSRVYRLWVWNHTYETPFTFVPQGQRQYFFTFIWWMTYFDRHKMTGILYCGSGLLIQLMGFFLCDISRLCTCWIWFSLILFFPWLMSTHTT